jgi:hypothetical protein
MNTLEKVRKAPSNKAMGIEIECVLPRTMIEDLPEYLGFFYKGEDYSIDSDWAEKGVEFVSQPLTYEWMNKEIKKLYAKVGHALKTNASCGIHVHVSKKWLSDKKAKDIYDVLKNLTDDDLRTLFGRGRNSYTSAHYGTRYCLVNETNKHTNEFRMFKSGNQHWALYCIAMSQFMVEHAHHLTASMLFAFNEDYICKQKAGKI